MLFVTIPATDMARYSYMSSRLKELLLSMRNARKTLENFANASFDKVFAKCIYLFISESQQCENEIMSQIDSLDGSPHHENVGRKQQQPVSTSKITGMKSVCDYCEKVYVEGYKRLIKDNHLGNSLTSLMKNHLRIFQSSLTQLKQFTEAAVN